MREGIDFLQNSGHVKNRRVLCLVDGEHYPPVVRWAVRRLEELGAGIVGIVFLGGTEKISEGDLSDTFGNGDNLFRLEGRFDDFSLWAEIIEKTRPDTAIDLSDDPVVRFHDRMRIGSILLSLGTGYAGADFYFTPPKTESKLLKPGLRIWGTNKRVGKTAVSVYTAGVLQKHGLKPVIVSMGRGGPEEPEVILPEDVELTPDFLLEKALSGTHAASDCWEDAVLARVPTVGCRRCGGGMAGSPFISTVDQGVEMANRLDGDVIIMEGSGPTTPLVETDASILIVSARIPAEHSVDFFGRYRIHTSDMVIVTQCTGDREQDREAEEIYSRIKEIREDIPVALTGFELTPSAAIGGKKAVVTTTLASDESLDRAVALLEEKYNCSVTASSRHLSDRPRLKEDIGKGIKKCDILLTELKAAAIDVAARSAREYGKEIAFLHNRPVLLDGDVDSLEDWIIGAVGPSALRGRTKNGKSKGTEK
jgi:cyclic 2,3-diphosphoglycerate synthetase